MRRTLEGIGKRNVRKALSITPEMEMIFKELSKATDGKYSSAEIMSIILHESFKTDGAIRWFEQKYVNAEEYRIRILYRHEAGIKSRVIRSERMV
jgi:hypothetical protein